MSKDPKPVQYGMYSRVAQYVSNLRLFNVFIIMRQAHLHPKVPKRDCGSLQKISGGN